MGLLRKRGEKHFVILCSGGHLPPCPPSSYAPAEKTFSTIVVSSSCSPEVKHESARWALLTFLIRNKTILKILTNYGYCHSLDGTMK